MIKDLASNALFWLLWLTPSPSVDLHQEMDLVSGYDSDSDDDKPASSSLSSLLPAPTNKGAGLTLPPTKSNQKKKPEKRQIRIDALDKLQSDEEEVPQPKRAKTSEPSNGKSGLSGLLGMLPAPKQKGPPPPKEKSKEDAITTTSAGILAGSESRLNLDTSIAETKKVKGNNDFRAMLGLKPSKLPEKVVSSMKIQPPAPPIATSTVSEPTKEEIVTSPKQPDFFSLSERSSKSSLDRANPTFAISTAPAVEEKAEEIRIQTVDEEDRYKGWQQGPDGNWFPVTPQAHTAYNEYLATQAIAPDRFTDRPADMQIGDINNIQSVDANASRQAWLSRPSTEDATGLDRKYAMAAASIATPDQGIPLVDQEEEVKKMDKKTNFRARRKGQLSALIAQAEENREKLEERWSKGKDGRNAAKEKYGF
jgi:hypothetical protein